jgi:heat shock protein HslJ
MQRLRALLLLALPALAACPLEGGARQQAQADPTVASQEETAVGPQHDQARLLAELAGSRWQLAEGLPGHDPGQVPVTLAFEGEGRISGNGGCNGYSADIRASADGVRIGPVVATKRGCPGARNQVEVAWFGALATVEGLRRDDGSLLLLGEDLRLRLVPAGSAD